jgi:pimeloyl-ACP methyl ester carboxylesterase
MKAAAPALALIAAPLLAQSSLPSSAALWWRDYADHAQQVPIGGGRTLNLLCQGRGSPTIILESGTGDGMTVWRKVQPTLAQHYRVCAYDRAGLGLSPPDSRPRDLDDIVSDLERLTKRARLQAPYVLVSHSFGGMVARLYARRHPANVAAMVLVDPPSEGETARIARIIPGAERMISAQIKRDRACASAKAPTRDCEPDMPDDAPPAVAARLRTAVRVHHLAEAAELAGIAGPDDAEMERAGTNLGNMPLIVLTSEQFEKNQQMPAGLRTASQKLWMTFHDEIAAHSKRGSNRIVPATGHYIQLERPDSVVAAVEELAAPNRAR